MEINRRVSLTDLFGVSFWLWFIITLICIVLMFLAPDSKKELASVILATFMLLPVRGWAYWFTIWIITWGGSGTFPKMKTVLRQIFTTVDLASAKVRTNNSGVYRLLRFIILVINIICALLWMANPDASFEVVYSWLHTIEYLFTGKIGWYPLLFYILLTIAFWCLIVWAVLQVICEKMLDSNGHFSLKLAWWRILVIVGGFYIKIIFSGILLKFSASMIWDSVKFWTIVVGFNVLSVVVFEIIRRIPNFQFPSFFPRI